MKNRFSRGWRLIDGLVIWAIWFLLIYGGLALACNFSAPSPADGPYTWINLTLLLITLLTAIYLAWKGMSTLKQTNQLSQLEQFLQKIESALYFFAAIATLAIGAPVVKMAPCL